MLHRLLRGKPKQQLHFNWNREREPDRNFHQGGRSFYFFDFDDNVAFLSTPIYVFHKQTGQELVLSTREYYLYRHLVGAKKSHLADYEFVYDDVCGSFRNFRDRKFNFWEKLFGKKQVFQEDLLETILHDVDINWKAPSWEFFYHATFNQRPLSIITARGHNPQTIVRGIDEFVRFGHLPYRPNFLGVYPVSHPSTRVELGDIQANLEVPELKKLAIKRSVEAAIAQYGESDYHRFGMSDDDPHNIELIYSAMEDLKRTYPKMSFFVIETKDGFCRKHEVVLGKKNTHLSVGNNPELPF